MGVIDEERQTIQQPKRQKTKRLLKMEYKKKKGIKYTIVSIKIPMWDNQ